MKKSVAILILLVSTIGFDACRKDKEPDTPYTMLEGRWRVIEIGMDSNNNGKLDNDEKKEMPFNDVEYFYFDLSGTGAQDVIFNGVMTDYPFTWTIITKNSDNSDSVNNDLQRIVLNDTLRANIETLTKTRLVLRNYTSPALSWYIMKKL